MIGKKSKREMIGPPYCNKVIREIETKKLFILKLTILLRLWKNIMSQVESHRLVLSYVKIKIFPISRKDVQQNKRKEEK